MLKERERGSEEKALFRENNRLLKEGRRVSV
jgi:hypothetical protein